MAQTTRSSSSVDQVGQQCLETKKWQSDGSDDMVIFEKPEKHAKSWTIWKITEFPNICMAVLYLFYGFGHVFDDGIDSQNVDFLRVSDLLHVCVPRLVFGLDICSATTWMIWAVYDCWCLICVLVYFYIGQRGTWHVSNFQGVGQKYAFCNDWNTIQNHQSEVYVFICFRFTNCESSPPASMDFSIETKTEWNQVPGTLHAFKLSTNTWCTVQVRLEGPQVAVCSTGNEICNKHCLANGEDVIFA